MSCGGVSFYSAAAMLDVQFAHGALTGSVCAPSPSFCSRQPSCSEPLERICDYHCMASPRVALKKRLHVRAMLCHSLATAYPCVPLPASRIRSWPLTHRHVWIRPWLQDFSSSKTRCVFWLEVVGWVGVCWSRFVHVSVSAWAGSVNLGRLGLRLDYQCLLTYRKPRLTYPPMPYAHAKHGPTYPHTCHRSSKPILYSGPLV